MPTGGLRLLLAAGARADAVSRVDECPGTPLDQAMMGNMRRVYPHLLRAGARLDLDLLDELPSYSLGIPYLREVNAVGWKKYEQAHRRRLATTFGAKFPRLPLDVVSHMVDFCFHVGFY